MIRLFALFFLALAAVPLCAQITPAGDSYTNSSNPTTNFGAKNLLNVQSASQTTYIQFDLSSIPAGYTGSNIAKATLKLYVNTVPTAGSFNVDFVNGSWSEKTITSNMAPALGTTIAPSVALSNTNVKDYILVDVTAALQAWLNGTQPNDGIALVANSPLSATFDSKETTTQSHPPEIDVVFTSSSGGGITGINTASGSGLQGGGNNGTLNLSLIKSCSNNQVLKWNGSAWACANLTGSGTVTSVGLSAPSSEFTVTGSPITTSGTLGLNWVVPPNSGNTANSIVKRDSNGSFNAGNIVTAGSLTSAGNLLVKRSDTGSNGTRVDVVNTATTGNSFGIFAATGGAVVSALYADGLGTSPLARASGYVGTFTSHPLGIYTGNVSRIYIGADGAVGIPTTSPLALLNVNQGFSSNTLLVGNTAKGIMLRDTGGALDLESLGDPLYINNTSHQPIYLNPTSGNTGLGTVFPDPAFKATVGTFGDPLTGLSGLKVETYLFVQGDATVSGALAVFGPKSFRIDHPLDPANKYLKHAAIESSEVLNMYTGNVRLDAKGEAEVEFPAWFSAINTDFRYQLTAVGAPGPGLYVSKEIDNGAFRIAGGTPGMKVSWEVTCLRSDPYMKAHPMAVEEDKPAYEAGFYGHPELYGQPDEKRIGSPAQSAARKKLSEQTVAK